MTFVNYAVQHKELLSKLTQSELILFTESSYSKINRIKNDNKRLSVGQMVVNNQGTIVSLNQRFILMWNLTECMITARCERQILRFIAEQLSDPYNFLVNIKNIHSQRSLEIQEIIKLKDGRSFSHKMKSQRLEKTVVGRVYQFRNYHSLET